MAPLLLELWPAAMRHAQGLPLRQTFTLSGCSLMIRSKPGFSYLCHLSSVEWGG